MADASFNIVIGVQNRERIKQLEEDIKSAEQQINSLSQAINNAGQATSQQANLLRIYGQDIQGYRNEISDLSKENIRLGESASEFGSRGVSSMVRGLKQISEGSESLVMTIPRVAMTLGASGELALALGVIAVAIDELGKKWEDLNITLSDTSGFSNIASQITAMADLMLSNTGLPSVEDWWKTWNEISEENAAKLKEKKKLASLEESAADLPTEEETMRAKAFKKLLPEYGEVRLKKELARSTTAPGEEPNKQAKEFAISQIAMGMKGKNISFGKEFDVDMQREIEKQEYIAQKKVEEADAREKKASVAQMEQNRKEEQRNQDKWNKEAEKAFTRQELDNKKEQENKLQDQIVLLERQKRGQAEAFRERQLEDKYEFHRGGQAIAEAYQTDAVKEIAKNQLKVQQDMQKGIEKVKDELTAIRRIGVGATVQ